MTQIVTGDAVLLDLRLARLPMRIMGACIDLLVVAGGLVAWNYVMIVVVTPGTSAAAATLAQLIGSILMLYGYPIVTETLTRGRTLGKLAAGTRTVRDDGGIIRFRHALLRGIAFWTVDFAPWTLCLGGFVSSAFNSQGKRLGDLMAGTMVIRTRPPRSRPPVTEIPNELADWARRVELSGVSPELFTAARQYVQRRAELLPHPQATIANDLATRLHAKIAPPPPKHLEPEEFLAVIVAERRRRESERVQRRSNEWVPTADELPSGWR